jgi:hypothetical protein
MENFIYKVGAKDDKTQKVEEKINVIAAQDLQILSYSYDIYSEKKIFTIHGIKSEVYAKDIVFVLKMQNTN